MPFGVNDLLLRDAGNLPTAGIPGTDYPLIFIYGNTLRLPGYRFRWGLAHPTTAVYNATKITDPDPSIVIPAGSLLDVVDPANDAVYVIGTLTGSLADHIDLEVTVSLLGQSEFRYKIPYAEGTHRFPAPRYLSIKMGVNSNSGGVYIRAVAKPDSPAVVISRAQRVGTMYYGIERTYIAPTATDQSTDGVDGGFPAFTLARPSDIASKYWPLYVFPETPEVDVNGKLREKLKLHFYPLGDMTPKFYHPPGWNPVIKCRWWARRTNTKPTVIQQQSDDWMEMVWDDSLKLWTAYLTPLSDARQQIVGVEVVNFGSDSLTFDYQFDEPYKKARTYVTTARPEAGDQL